jgi:hypothetical protein
LVELEKEVQDSSNPERINFLEGKEETPEQIMKRLEQVCTKILSLNNLVSPNSSTLTLIA